MWISWNSSSCVVPIRWGFLKRGKKCITAFMIQGFFSHLISAIRPSFISQVRREFICCSNSVAHIPWPQCSTSSTCYIWAATQTSHMCMEHRMSLNGASACCAELSCQRLALTGWEQHQVRLLGNNTTTNGDCCWGIRGKERGAGRRSG